MIIKGFINIQNVTNTSGKTQVYTGGDIHATEEAAKLIANKNTIGQIYIAFEYEPEAKRTRDMRAYYGEKELEEGRFSERIGVKAKRKYTRKVKEESTS